MKLKVMSYTLRKKAAVLLADGTIFYGKAIGKEEGTNFGEVCFNTGMTGYQEIFTDPSYFGQIMVTTNAHIGNYGSYEDDMESDDVKISGLVCRNFSYNHSRKLSTGSLEEFLSQHHLIGISDVDTRSLVTYIREKGAQNAAVTTEIEKLETIKKELQNTPNMEGLELSSKVSAQEPYYIGDQDSTYKIAALDIGIKKNILKNLAKRDCHIKVFPHDSSFEKMEAWQPDGYFLSNGPGDPEPMPHVIELTKEIIEQDRPLLGICLGHQIIALANGVLTYKMHQGHRGINHPVKNIKTGKGEITSQNHGFSVNREEVEKNDNLEITHYHLNDNSVAGLKMKNKNCFSVQYHPEASPGPHDAHYLFDEFIDNIKKSRA
jgi:carbamoyl-phosphate synthase small subunit